MKTLVKVRQKHIKAGRPGATRCPVALATNECLGLEVGKVSIWFSSWGIGYKDFPLPRSARRFVSGFDSGKKVKPFNFFLVQE